MIKGLTKASFFNWRSSELLLLDAIQFGKAALDSFHENETKEPNIRSCPASAGRGNRAMETPRCLLRDGSSGGCDFRKCGGNKKDLHRSITAA